MSDLIKKFALEGIQKGFDNSLQKGAALPEGSRRTWGGVEYVKTAGKWTPKGKDGVVSKPTKMKDVTSVKKNDVIVLKDGGRAKVLSLLDKTKLTVKLKSGEERVINLNSIDSIITSDKKEEKDFSDYTNSELQQLYNNTKDEVVKKELHKRSQKLKELTRTDKDKDSSSTKRDKHEITDGEIKALDFILDNQGPPRGPTIESAKDLVDFIRSEEPQGLENITDEQIKQYYAETDPNYTPEKS